MLSIFRQRRLLIFVFLIAGAYNLCNAQSAVADRLVVHGGPSSVIFDRHIFGQFVEHVGQSVYDGIWVGPNSSIPNIDGYRRDVVDGVRALHVPVIRWPGGCFADGYHWRDGIGPRDRRPARINANWGSVPESNAFGTHEFMGFSTLVGAENYIAINLGSSPPAEGAEWLQYITLPAGSTLARERADNGHKDPWSIAMIGIGNELWGCGGNMTADYAADVTRRYVTFLKSPDSMHVQKIASGPYGDNYGWTDTMMRKAGDLIDGLSLHYYTVPGSYPTGFGEDEWVHVLSLAARMDTILTGQERVMDKYDPKRRVALIVDEWGTWYDVPPDTHPAFLFQQNTLRDALVASVTFDIFAHHAQRVRGANIAQMVNVLQALFLTDGAATIRTPTYWAFDLYKDYQDASVLPIDIESHPFTRAQWTVSTLSASAVRGKDNVVHLALTNTDAAQADNVVVTLDEFTAKNVSGRILTAAGMDTHNSPSQPDALHPVKFDNATLADHTLTVRLPPKSVVMLDLY